MAAADGNWYVESVASNKRLVAHDEFNKYTGYIIHTSTLLLKTMLCLTRFRKGGVSLSHPFIAHFRVVIITYLAEISLISLVTHSKFFNEPSNNHIVFAYYIVQGTTVLSFIPKKPSLRYVSRIRSNSNTSKIFSKTERALLFYLIYLIS